MAAEEPNEDVNYEVDSFAIEDLPDTSDELEGISPESALVQELRAYLDKALAEHNSFDVLHIPQNATPEDKVAVFDEMFNHKGMVHHIRQLQQIINNRVKEK